MNIDKTLRPVIESTTSRPKLYSLDEPIDWLLTYWTLWDSPLRLPLLRCYSHAATPSCRCSHECAWDTWIKLLMYSDVSPLSSNIYIWKNLYILLDNIFKFKGYLNNTNKLINTKNKILTGTDAHIPIATQVQM